jgi:hypothetical protein
MFGDVEKQKVETFERLVASYSPRQMRALNTTGYAIMSKRQLKMLYGEGKLIFGIFELKVNLQELCIKKFCKSSKKSLK